MKKRILVFGASTSRTSINQAFATFAASQLTDFDTQVVKLKDFDIPLFSVDKEKEDGFPDDIIHIKTMIQSADGIILSLAEHNGAYTAAFKNVFDWLSRLEGKAWDNKPMLLLSTSPGGRGGSSVMEIATKRFPFNGGNVISTFSLPGYHKNFSPENGVLDEELDAGFRLALKTFIAHFE